MIWFLRLFFIVVLGSMLAVTTWASLGESITDFFRGPVAKDRWFWAAMADAYWGFLTFYIWLAYKETSFLARTLWLLAILAFGNIAMAIYCLIQLFKVPAGAKLEDVLLRRRAS